MYSLLPMDLTSACHFLRSSHRVFYVLFLSPYPYTYSFGIKHSSRKYSAVTRWGRLSHVSAAWDIRGVTKRGEVLTKPAVEKCLREIQ